MNTPKTALIAGHHRERFAKLQDTMGAAMRHSLLLSGEQADSFIKVLAIFEKNGVIQSVENWQVAPCAATQTF